MSNNKMRGLFSALLMVLLLATTASAQSHWVGVTVTEAQIDDIVIQPLDWNRLSLERNQEFELELHLESLRDADDVEIEAEISGYEHNTLDPIEARIGPFDFDENVTYIKRMRLSLPDDVEEDDYKLRLYISDRDGFETLVHYNLKLDVPRHSLKIEDVLLTPGSSVKAGSALLASVRVENKGERDEDDVKVVVAIPELGVSAAEYIEEIGSGDEERETEELYLKLPRCAEPGEYAVRIDVLYNNLKDTSSAVTKINVVENEACVPEEPPVVIVEQPEEEQKQTESVADVAPGKSKLRTALEIILVVLIGLLILVGLVIGFSRMRADE